MDAMMAIKQTFFQECEEQLAELENGLLAIQDGDKDPETVNAVFRAVHSIKGGAGAFSLDDLVRFSHVFETTLDDLRAGVLAPNADVLKTLLRAADMLADLVRAARDGGTVDAGRSQAIIEDLAALTHGQAEGVSAETNDDDDGQAGFSFQPVQACLDDLDFDDFQNEPAETLFTIRFKPKPDLYAKANETALLLRGLKELGEMEVVCDASDLPLLSELDPEGAYLTFTITLLTQHDEAAVRGIFEFVEWDCDLTIESCATPAAKSEVYADVTSPDLAAADAHQDISDKQKKAQIVHAEPVSESDQGVIQPERREQERRESNTTAGLSPATIRVDLDRVDRLIDLVGELVINQAMLAQSVTEAGLARATNIATGLDELEQLTREIQDSVMAIRAQPVKSVFQRMPRLVREVAAMTGKSVRLVTEGENTEVDKTVIERLTDPLTHMIRNAIDHGLETPEKRLAAGKPEEGTVHLCALHRSGRIVIEIADDGAGINRPRVKQIAIDKGLISADVTLTDDEIDNLIFLPGFSTAATISDISGRGVGMDVVRRSIQALGGRISISSRPGQGSTFTMSLPLTLAVLDGMVVSVADQTLVVPLTAIVETLQPKSTDVHGFGGAARVIAIRDQFTPLIDVGRELAYRRVPADPLASVVILVETEGGVRNALLVDAIQGQRQVVIKSLEANYRHVPGIAAATILGDGRVALILDVESIVTSARTDVFQDGPQGILESNQNGNCFKAAPEHSLAATY
ncbi:chemotaxis protein CheA [Beijerinckia indica]|uniref:Chemotaxis protein CheA n=1 Tax=Beijerinckia indica subsp. indica (strain ATCC 9039 / DSM 1715 / NCIMB 8712) TaxID=395963 RepID=B2IGA2_BEII9|nr:chemotaxis protein CheA [Beijerinckia indica]ACB97176.1 CheA signal transduction histidine kinase [Beijerinckia indica subsp. indica ATCC 9039]